MKKRNSFAILTIASGAILGLASCGPTQPAHTHSYKLHDKVDPTCLAEGSEAYYSCDGCDKLFNENKEEISQIESIPASAHVPHHHDGEEPSCTDPGKGEYWTCDNEVDNKLYSDAECKTVIGEIPVVPAKGHAQPLTHHDQVDATCMENGVKEYWECPDCDNFFSDSAAQNLIGDADALADWKTAAGKINPLGHKTKLVPGLAPTKTTSGWKDYYQCERCLKFFKDANATVEITDLEAWKTGEGYLAPTLVPVTSISLSAEKSSIAIGEATSLSVSVLPADADEKGYDLSVVSGGEYVSIEGNVVTGVSAGTVVLKAVSKDNISIVSAEISIEVYSIPVTSVEFDLGEQRTVLYPEQTIELNAKVLPADATNKEVEYSVADSSTDVVTISEGVLTAVAPGTKTINVVSVDDETKSDSFVVTVENDLILKMTADDFHKEGDKGIDVKVLVGKEAEDKFSDRKSVVKFTLNENASEWPSDWMNIPTEKLDTYEHYFSFDIYGENTSPMAPWVEAQLHADDSSWSEVDRFNVDFTANSWTHVELKTTNHVEDLQFLKLCFDKENRGTSQVVYIDNLKVEDVVPATKLELSASKTVLSDAGETSQLTPIFTPSTSTFKDVVYSVAEGSEAILSVSDSGLVTPLGIGKGTINATSVVDSTITTSIDIEVSGVAHFEKNEQKFLTKMTSGYKVSDFNGKNISINVRATGSGTDNIALMEKGWGNISDSINLKFENGELISAYGPGQIGIGFESLEDGWYKLTIIPKGDGISDHQNDLLNSVYPNAAIATDTLDVDFGSLCPTDKYNFSFASGKEVTISTENHNFPGVNVSGLGHDDVLYFEIKFAADANGSLKLNLDEGWKRFSDVNMTVVNGVVTSVENGANKPCSGYSESLGDGWNGIYLPFESFSDPDKIISTMENWNRVYGGSASLPFVFNSASAQIKHIAHNRCAEIGADSSAVTGIQVDTDSVRAGSSELYFEVKPTVSSGDTIRFNFCDSVKDKTAFNIKLSYSSGEFTVGSSTSGVSPTMETLADGWYGITVNTVSEGGLTIDSISPFPATVGNSVEIDLNSFRLNKVVARGIKEITKDSGRWNGFDYETAGVKNGTKVLYFEVKPTSNAETIRINLVDENGGRAASPKLSYSGGVFSVGTGGYGTAELEELDDGWYGITVTGFNTGTSNYIRAIEPTAGTSGASLLINADSFELREAAPEPMGIQEITSSGSTAFTGFAFDVSEVPTVSSARGTKALYFKVKPTCNETAIRIEIIDENGGKIGNPKFIYNSGEFSVSADYDNNATMVALGDGWYGITLHVLASGSGNIIRTVQPAGGTGGCSILFDGDSFELI